MDELKQESKRFFVDGDKAAMILESHFKQEGFLTVVFAMVGRPIYIKASRDGFFVDFLMVMMRHDPEYLEIEVYTTRNQPKMVLAMFERLMQREGLIKEKVEIVRKS